MAFRDSQLFEIKNGQVVHKRRGDSYAEKTINGVPLESTIGWDTYIESMAAKRRYERINKIRYEKSYKSKHLLFVTPFL